MNSIRGMTIIMDERRWQIIATIDILQRSYQDFVSVIEIAR